MAKISRIITAVTTITALTIVNHVEGFVTPRLPVAKRTSLGFPNVAKTSRLAASGSSTAVAGNVFSTLQKFVITKSKAKQIGAELAKTTHLGDLAIICFFWFGGVLLTRVSIRGINWLAALSDKKLSKPPQNIDEQLKQSTMYQIAKSVSRLSMIGGFVYIVDMLMVVLKELGISLWNVRWNNMVAQIGFMIWVAQCLSIIQVRILSHFAKVPITANLGKYTVFRRVGNAILTIMSVFLSLEIISFHTGISVGSFFALGGVGTLVLSLASRDLAADLVSGLALSSKNLFYEGEHVVIGGDKYVGCVARTGWMSTTIRGYDEKMARIPNSCIANEKIENLSRITRSQVKQTVMFEFQDVDKLPKLTEDIKGEIKASCPKLITDGSRPFWCHWRGFDKTELEVVVDAHFMIPFGTTEYYDTRQKVMEAINRAVKKNKMDFAVPILSVRNKDTKRI